MSNITHELKREMRKAVLKFKWDQIQKKNPYHWPRGAELRNFNPADFNEFYRDFLQARSEFYLAYSYDKGRTLDLKMIGGVN